MFIWYEYVYDIGKYLKIDCIFPRVFAWTWSTSFINMTWLDSTGIWVATLKEYVSSQRNRDVKEIIYNKWNSAGKWVIPWILQCAASLLAT